MRIAARLALPLLLVLTGCGRAAGPAPVPPEALAAVDAPTLLGHIQVLASDSFLGRLPGSPGEEKTVGYLEAEFRRLGLAPGNPDSTFMQNVSLVSMTADPEMTIALDRGNARRRLSYRDDFVAWTRHVTDGVELVESELVFVGYGIEAPEQNWDDYKGQDVAGKILVMLVNDPLVEGDSSAFGGLAMTYYGRWTYKYEIGARKGAAGVLIIHETGPAGYPWEVVQGMGGEKFDLVSADRNLGKVTVEGWLHLDRARDLLRRARLNFDSLKTAAARRDFHPAPLGIRASVRIRNTLRTVDSRNVVARLEGSDPLHRDEYVIYTAHWDHFGVGVPVDGDSIYNGAVDNATGAAGLLTLARAFAAMPVAPRRSILFLAVTAEEQGLLGSRAYAENPLYPLAKTLANLNLDAMGVSGRTRDVTVIGLGASELDDYAAEAAREQGRGLRPDAEPEKGFYYRSDHFNFAKQGVPAFYADEGVDFIDKPADYGRQVRERYTSQLYHKPADEVYPEWDLSGLVEDLRLLLAIGYRVAQAARYPEWRPGNEFRAIREAQRAPPSP